MSRDLETICLKCLEKEPTRRYDSAQAVARELELFLQGRPIKSRPVGAVEHGWRWCRRNRVLASLLLAVFSTLLIGVSISSYLAVRAATHARLTLRHRYRAEIQLAQALTADNRMRRLLDDVAADPDLNKLRRFEWNYLNRLCTREVITIKESGQYRGALSVDYSSNGRLLAWGWGKYVQVWDVQTGKKTRDFGAPKSFSSAVAFSNDDRKLTAGGADGTLLTWDVETGEEAWAVHQAHIGAINSVAISSNGELLASAGNDQQVIFWDSQTGQRVRSVDGGDTINSLSFSPDSQWLAAGLGAGTVVAWQMPTADNCISFVGPKQQVGSVSFSPDSQRLAAGSDDQSVWIWDVATRRLIKELPGHGGEVTGVAFSPDGGRLLSCNRGKPIGPEGSYAEVLGVSRKAAGCRIWDSHSFQELLHLSPPAVGLADGYFVPLIDRIQAIFSPNNKHLACALFCVGGGPGALHVWDADLDPKPYPVSGAGTVTSLDFSGDGRRLAGAGQDKTVYVWQIRQGDRGTPIDSIAPTKFVGHSDLVNSVRYSPDSRILATAGRDGVIRLWDAESGRETFTLHGDTKEVTCLAFRPDGRWLVSGHSSAVAKMWDLTSKRICFTVAGHLATTILGCSVEKVGFQPGSLRDPCTVTHFWSMHPGGGNFAFADGSVRFLSYNANQILVELSTRNGGEVVPGDF